ncbi:hypothetical protein STCU_08611 [Strigomonas culicis]|uniref:Aminoglycoside phosphotransferase domain-containing protein n=1 Tax=Strigomonas culicis TaxID=28005 RepID=S9TXC3_9TRYP|nr:hypothetical protein STCU_08611 [Strigomonas culicis]|eukprot:EPY21293.1 hypothetical protein STCU_08611 [Strigomonas culicis]
MMDLAGVLNTSPFHAARRLAERMMRCVFYRAGSHLTLKMKNRSVDFLARQYCNFFFTVTDFTERIRGSKSAFERLELGEINRVEFIPEFKAEMTFMLSALEKENIEELEAMSITYPNRVQTLRKRFPLLTDTIVQSLVLELMDVEAFLCTIEKVSPRKNVLNLLHYLRVKSQQEIRLYAMGNTWETEGQYRRMLKTMHTSVSDSVSTAFPVTCPIEYGKEAKFNNFFQVNGLFDGYIQSYTYHKRKPFPDIFLHALDQVTSSRTPTGDALRFDIKPYIFYFDDVGDHCEVARELSGDPFTEVFLIEDGACDVFKDVIAALKMVAVKDPFWDKVVEGIQKDMTPLFKPPTDPNGKGISWVEEEINNYNNNLLFIAPPQNDICHPVNVLEKRQYQMDEEDQDAILYYCAQHLPHLFPIDIPDQPQKGMRLAHKPGLATSAGPITFDYFEGSKYFQTFRITLRTGSYVLRIQPCGPNPFDSADIKNEYEAMMYLSHLQPQIHIPTMLLYCDSYAVCGRRFFIRRYVDGEVVTNIRQLIQPRIHRPYSERRRVVNVELKPKLFYRAAVAALAAMHNVPLPAFLHQRDDTTQRMHPLLRRINGFIEQYQISIQDSGSQGCEALRSTEVERLCTALRSCFDQTQISHLMVPFPDRLVISHGHFDMTSLVFSHRSLEGRAKYPPSLVGSIQYRFTHEDDPLLDVAALSLFHFIPSPEGLYDAPKSVKLIFPTPGEIMDYYCTFRGYMRHMDRVRREDIFNVYLAALCLQRATRIVVNLAGIMQANNNMLDAAENRNIAFADQMARRGIELLLRRQKAKV